MKLKIDNKEIETGANQTILNVASEAGLHIPTLCHMEGIEPYSSCMVCVVRDKKTNNYIPSCTAKILDGMDIDASSDEVVYMRKKAVELLLSEHRAECEAPCRIVCPAGYNIPLMNRLLQAGKTDEAIELAFKEISTPKIVCIDCPGYCENACRRKKIDEPVSIRNIMIFVYSNIKKEYTSGTDNSLEASSKEEDLTKQATNKVRKRFSSRIGKLEKEEQKEWLKECIDDAVRIREITAFRVAGTEAENCMHCDCRAANDCRLRDVAIELNIKDPPGKLVNAPILKKISKKGELIFENAKCIKCGLCVRVGEDNKDQPSLCFINRGFVSIISEPLTEKFENIQKAKADIYIDVCPTGALSRFR